MGERKAVACLEKWLTIFEYFVLECLEKIYAINGDECLNLLNMSLLLCSCYEAVATCFVLVQVLLICSY